MEDFPGSLAKASEVNVFPPTMIQAHGETWLCLCGQRIAVLSAVSLPVASFIFLWIWEVRENWS